MTLALTVRGAIIVINVGAVIVIAGIIGYRVLSVRREPVEKPPQNLTPFFDDDTLEGRKLERVLRWALLFSVVIAVGLPLYWLIEPYRQEAEAKGFDKRAAERGATLFANAQMAAYDPTKSLLCANCHGTDAGGGSTNFVLTPDAQGNPNGRPAQVTWRAPALNTVFSRFDEDQVRTILVYGRPGTPMPAWGVAGGGPKNDQSINDLIAYLKSIQLPHKKVLAASVKAVQDLKQTALDPSTGWVATAEKNLAAAKARLAAATTPAERASAEQDVARAQVAVRNSQDWASIVATASEGELSFMTNCARCHTKGWSYLDPTNPLVPLPSRMGGGALGPSLVDGAVLNQFPGTPGREKQIEWVTVGAPPFKPYGVRGISSGKMAHFADTLTKDQIDAIVDYERSL